MLRRFTPTLLAGALLLGLGQAANAVCPADGATPMNIGPLSPQTTFPLWVQDSTGLTVEVCPGTDPLNCISTPPITDPLDPAYVAELAGIGFGDEGFMASADAIVATAAGQALMVSAVELAFLPDFNVGNQFPFTRLRIRIDVSDPGDYTVTHPWGQIQYTGVQPGPNAINDSFDIQFFPDQIGYQGRIGPILTWDTYPIDLNTGAADPALDLYGPPFTFDPPFGAPPPDGIADYIGTLATTHTVTGSPCGTNFFRVEGPNIGGPGVNLVETNLFTVTGKVFTATAPTPLNVDRTTYARVVNGQVDVFATSAPTATVTVSGGPNLPPTPTNLASDGAGLFFASVPVGDASLLPATVTVTASNAGNLDTVLTRPLIDVVSITRAEYDISTGVLSVDANSSDRSPTDAPTLTLAPFGAFAFDPAFNGDLAAGTVSIINLLVPPASVTVMSSAGGQATLPVSVLAGAVAGNTRPLAVDDAFTTNEDTPAVLTVLANDSDPDTAADPTNTIDVTTVTIGGTGPANGTAVANADGTVTYTPNVNFNGIDTFTYVVRDTVGAFSNPATVTVTVSPVNDPPIAVNDVASVNINNSTIISVLANDTDPEANILANTVTIVSQGTLGTATAQANGTVIYAAGATSGVDTFTYTVADGAGAVSNIATVTVNVNNVVAEQITIALAQFRTRAARWTINGTTTVPGPGNQITAVLQRTGQTIGTAAVDAVGGWAIDVRNSPITAVAGDVVVVTSTGGATASQVVSVRL